MNKHVIYSDELYRGNRRDANADRVAELVGRHNKQLLRFLTCGSVDDGKSTLIGRLLYESQLIHDDQLASLERDSRRFGTTGEDLDFALLVDGLEDERQQGITIDVAYRFFTTAKRSFIVADTPGHEQYTRNMATGASNSDVAVLLVDARKGLLPQTKRHATICSLLGIRKVIVAVNKIDLVDYSEGVFDEIISGFEQFALELSFTSITAIPVSARFGDNVCAQSENMPWYRGDTLVDTLEAISVDRNSLPFRMAVQWISRPSLDFRGYAGTVASGVLKTGDRVGIAPGGQEAKIARILGPDGDVGAAHANDAVTVTLDSEIDVSRGDVLFAPSKPPVVADQFSAHLLWMSQEELLSGRQYTIRIGMRYLPATITAIKHKLDVESLGKLATHALQLNEIGMCNVSIASDMPLDPYEDNAETGSFVLIDRFTNQTVGLGMIEFALRRAANLHRQKLSVDKQARSALKNQKPSIVWLTGLSGSGKSTIANALESQLLAYGHHSYLLDGDNVRLGLNRDLGFTDADRVENIRRVGEVAKLMVDAGLVVIASFISPFEAERAMAKELVGEEEFIEVFVDTPLEECIERDPKGLYAKAKKGDIENFTGFDSRYERPLSPHIHLKTMEQSPDDLAEQIMDYLRVKGMIIS
ncbi:MAG: sulfate adenylyltransferase subunit CysN [Hyphomicrobiales bacterium]